MKTTAIFTSDPMEETDIVMAEKDLMEMTDTEAGMYLTEIDNFLLMNWVDQVDGVDDGTRGQGGFQ